jgi:cation-transporting ATPase E
MTGDGVNDVLALKEADCSVAMMSGSDAAKNVSSLVLLDNNFASMPKVVAEGRRSINNLQRSTSMFLIKTIYATLLSFLFVFVSWSYPFIPRQLTLVSSMTVAIPSLIIALEPNTDIVKGRFIDNAIKNSLPGAFTILVNLFIMLFVANAIDLPNESQSTIATILLGVNMFIILFKVCMPFTLMRATIFLSCFTGFLYAILFMGNFLQLGEFTREMLYILIPMLILCYPLMISVRAIVSHYIKKNQLRFMDRLLNFSENRLQNLTIKKNKDDRG